MVEVRHSFKDYEPPRWLDKTVQRLLASLSEEHVAGLEAIVLTDSASIGKGKTNRVRGRKYKRNECLGFYHPAWKGQLPWIEIVVDNMLRGIPPRAFVLSSLRDFVIGDTLYHEIGHHLHETVGSAARGGEYSADDWSRRLRRIHEQRRHRYLRPLLRIAGRCLTLFKGRTPPWPRNDASQSR
jgi:hypothetical protein